MSASTYGPSGPDRRGEPAAVGPVIDILIGGADRSSVVIPARALIDTGASVVVIDRRIALRLGLKAMDLQDVGVAGGSTFSSTIYMGRLAVPELAYSELTRLYAAPMREASHDVLLGRSFLRNFIVTFNGPEGMFHFARPTAWPGSLGEDDYAT